MAVRGAREVEDFRFRRLEKPEELRSVEEVHAAAWAGVEDPPVPSTLQRAMQDNGGLVLGALADIHLAGFTAGFLGWDGTTLYHYSVATAVRPEYQNHHVAFRLKAFQRDEVLRQGLAQIRLTFDPLHSRTAFLYVRRLGLVPDRYHVHYFGRLGSGSDEGGETDRVRATWEIASARVVDRMAGKLPSPADDETRWNTSVSILETEAGESGIRVPAAVVEPDAPKVHLEIPFDLRLVRDHEPESLRPWRHAVRDGFRAAFDLGYQVDDFAVVLVEHERRSVYFLSKRPGEAAPGVAGPPARPGGGAGPSETALKEG